MAKDKKTTQDPTLPPRPVVRPANPTAGGRYTIENGVRRRLQPDEQPGLPPSVPFIPAAKQAATDEET